MQNYPNQDSDATIVGGQPYNVGGQQQYGPQPPYQQPPKKSNTSMIIGILIGVAIMLIGGLVYILYSNSQRNADEAARLREQITADSLRAAKEKSAMAAEAEKQVAEAEAEAEAAREAATAAADAARFSTASGTYSGKVAGSRYTLSLTQDGSSLNGSGRWNNSSNSCEIYGSIYGNEVELEEWHYGEQTGYMQGTISGKYFKGTFHNSKGNSYSFTLTR